LGFNWGFLAIKKTGPEVAQTVLASIGFSADAVREYARADARRLFRQVSNMEKDKKGMGPSFLVTELDGWTFFESSDVIIDVDLSQFAERLKADVCWASAVSTTWTLSAEYARPDGTKRVKGFYLDIDFLAVGSEAFGIRHVRDKKGRVVGFDMMPKALIGPHGEIIPPEDLGKEELSGDPLKGEPLSLKVSDDERLIKYLAAIGVPVGAVFDRRYCSVPDMIAKDYSWDVTEACLEGVNRDKNVLDALNNNGRVEAKGRVYLSGPLVKAGKFILDQPKRSLFSRFKRGTDPVAS
jgi:hypothetical protein